MIPTDKFQPAAANSRPGVKPVFPKKFARSKDLFDLLNKVHMKSTRLILLKLVCAALLTACDQGALTKTVNQPSNSEGAPASVSAVHHLGRGHHIGEFSIDGRSCGNAGSPEKNSGGNTMCFISLPKEWRPGIKHKVRWGVTNFTDDLTGLQKGNSGQWYEVEAELERFGVGDPVFEVHFFPNGVVRLVPNGYGPPDEDTSPDQTPPLTETPLYAPSWYWMGQTLAKQKYEGLTKRYDIDGLKEEQAKADAYFAFLERLWRSRGLSGAQVKAKLDKERKDAESGVVGGHANYLTVQLRKLGYSNEQINEIRADRSNWTIDSVNQKISHYISLTGAKK